jgi:hypothetical protein
LKPIENPALLEDLFHFVHNLPSSARIMESKLRQELVIAKNEINEETLSRFLDFLARYFKCGTFAVFATAEILIEMFLDRETLIQVDDIAYSDVWWTGEISIPNSVRYIYFPCF